MYVSRFIGSDSRIIQLCDPSLNFSASYDPQLSPLIQRKMQLIGNRPMNGYEVGAGIQHKGGLNLISYIAEGDGDQYVVTIYHHRRYRAAF